MWQIPDRDAWACRWGHALTGIEYHRARTEGRVPRAFDLDRAGGWFGLRVDGTGREPWA